MNESMNASNVELTLDTPTSMMMPSVPPRRGFFQQWDSQQHKILTSGEKENFIGDIYKQKTKTGRVK